MSSNELNPALAEENEVAFLDTDGVIAETDKAIKFNCPADSKTAWIPKSVIVQYDDECVEYLAEFEITFEDVYD